MYFIDLGEMLNLKVLLIMLQILTHPFKMVCLLTNDACLKLDNNTLMNDLLVITMRVLKGCMLMMILWLVLISLGDNYAINHIC